MNINVKGSIKMFTIWHSDHTVAETIYSDSMEHAIEQALSYGYSNFRVTLIR